MNWVQGDTTRRWKVSKDGFVHMGDMKDCAYIVLNTILWTRASGGEICSQVGSSGGRQSTQGYIQNKTR